MNIISEFICLEGCVSAHLTCHCVLSNCSYPNGMRVIVGCHRVKRQELSSFLFVHVFPRISSVRQFSGISQFATSISNIKPLSSACGIFFSKNNEFSRKCKFHFVHHLYLIIFHSRIYLPLSKPSPHTFTNCYTASLTANDNVR